MAWPFRRVTKRAININMIYVCAAATSVIQLQKRARDMIGGPPLYNAHIVLDAMILRDCDPCEARERPSRSDGFCCFPGLLDGKGGSR